MPGIDIKKARELAERYMENKEFCCSESVLRAIAELVGREDYAELTALATGFCGGVGGSHAGMCGALSGGILALGMMFGRIKATDPKENKARHQAKALREWFIDKYATTTCNEILACVENCEEKRKARCTALAGAVAEQASALMNC